VALPFGMILGAIIYLLVISIVGDYESPQGGINKLRAYLLLGLLAAIVSHFVEINFGIAIAVTRTYFWVYTALLLLIGYLYPLISGFERVSQNGGDTVLALDEISSDRSFSQQYPDKSANENKNKNKSNDMGINHKKDHVSSKKKKRRFPKYKPKSNVLISSNWLNEAVIAGFIIAILLSTLAYDMISNAQGAKSAFDILWNSIVRLRNSSLENTYGVLVLLLVSWLTAAVIMTSETIISLEEKAGRYAQNWGKVFGTILLISSSLAVIFWVWHASGMAVLARSTVNSLDGILRQVQNSEGILTKYYIYLLLLIFGLALFVPGNWPKKCTRRKGFSIIGALVAFVVVFVVANITNIRVIQADIAFKTAESFTRSDTWPVAISIYNHAIELAPNEDYYYLFLGRAYLEYAKTLSEPSQREQLIQKAAEDLRSAQGINPLNTDHTANLARLYSLWSAFSSDPKQREEHAQTSSDYFSHAVILSPNNARIWDEWALHFLSVQNHPEDAYPLLKNSLELDPTYDWTYGLLGDYYVQKFENLSESPAEESSHALNQALENYQKAIELSQSTPNLLKSNYYVSIGGIYSRLGQLDETIISYEQAFQLAPQRVDGWQILEMLARLYAQRGDLDTAQEYVQMAVERTPDDQKARLEEFLRQITIQPY
jgi:tetratricopeptide (TPR) repeat protein